MQLIERGSFKVTEGRPRASDMVVKGNALVHASYVMTRQEKMMMWWAIWAYQKEGTPRLTIRCQDICEFLGIEHGQMYAQVWATARGLRQRELLLFKPEQGRVGACGFLSYAEYGDRRSGEVDIEITSQVVPYVEKFIADMKLGFTRYEMGVIASLRTFHGLRLYEIAKALNFGEGKRNGWDLTVEELRMRFGALLVDKTGKVVNDEYPEWKRFKEKVLDKAITEVNERSDLKVDYTVKKSGRNVTGVVLRVAANRPGGVVMRTENGNKDLAQEMAKLGVGSRMLRRLLDLYGDSDAERLHYALRATKDAMKNGKARKPAAWFVVAVKKDYRVQRSLFEERKLEAAERALDQQRRKDGAKRKSPDEPIHIADAGMARVLAAMEQNVRDRAKASAGETDT
jgi:plasmid replication initiation protein